MRSAFTLLTFAIGCLTVALHAAEPAGTLKAVKDRTDRGTLSDRREIVRGDTGRWSDKPALQPAPSIAQKPQGVSLDDWMEELAEKELSTTAADDHWLLFRTRQLDDNDRVWIERIERRGDEFTVLLNEAVWQGKYFKTFTYYEVDAVNLGPLPPGNYTVKWRVQPLSFRQLEKPAQPNRDNKENFPIDELTAAGKPVELEAKFSVR
jgi:hypothetical protein